MYETYYGLTSKPFQLNPDPSFYFGSKQHQRATAYLEYGIHQNEGFIVITGEIGAGKTTIVKGLLDKLDSNRVVAAHMVSTQVDAEDTLRLVGAAFGVKTKDLSKADVLMALEAFFTNNARKRKRSLLVVDEAQNLTPRAVEELRMLSNFQFGSHALLQSFLIGQPEFRDILRSPHMQQLKQRVIASCHIGPMDMKETEEYILHRLKCSGSTEFPTFEPKAFEAIYHASNGIPRRINTLCDRLLLLGFLGGKKHFLREDVEEVAKEIDEETLSPTLRRKREKAAGSISRIPAVVPEGAEIDPAAFDLDEETADIASELIAGLSGDQVSERLLRLERSMLRLERINIATLNILQQLINSVRPRHEDGGVRE
ncbi:MAG: XrtA/PEP-CTERM system-associated ATPase [Betaproteobacteria bacterium]